MAKRDHLLSWTETEGGCSSLVVLSDMKDPEWDDQEKWSGRDAEYVIRMSGGRVRDLKWSSRESVSEGLMAAHTGFRRGRLDQNGWKKKFKKHILIKLSPVIQASRNSEGTLHWLDEIFV